MPPVPLPTSPLDSLLSLLLPGVLLAGWVIAAQVTRRRVAAWFLAPGIALAAWIELAHLVGYVSRSFEVGLWLSTLALGGTGYWLASRPGLRPRARTLRVLLRPGMRWAWLSAAIATLLLAPIVLRYAFHDEIGASGHLANISTIQNGYPPRDLAYPQLELKYHYGFDLACAMLSAIVRLNASIVSDALTLACWAYVWSLAWLIGLRKAGRWGAVLTPLVLLYGAGSPLACPDQVKSTELGAQLVSFCSVGGMFTNPPYISYHFQHPWTVGLPIALCAILVFELAPRAPRRFALIGALLSSLAICQFVLFAALSATLPVAEAVRRGFRDRKSIALSVAASAGALLVARSSGGMFAPSGLRGSGLELHLGIAATGAQSLEWMARTFGLLLPLGLVGLLVLRRPRMVYAALLFGGVLIINLLRYKHSWDIVKFATLASVGLAAPAAALLARGLAARSVWLKLTAVAGLCVTMASSVGFQAALVLGLPGVPAMYLRTPPVFEPEDARAAAWLRAHMPARTAMYRRHDRFRPYASWAGLPQVWPENQFLGVLDPRARDQLLRGLPPEPEPWLAQKVRFFVLDDADGRLLAAASRWVADGRAVERARFGALRVIELPE